MTAKEKKRMEDIIKTIAIRDGMSVAEVRKEMSIVIAEAYKTGKATNNPMWDDWSRQPTPEEFILWVSKKYPKDNQKTFFS